MVAGGLWLVTRLALHSFMETDRMNIDQSDRIGILEGPRYKRREQLEESSLSICMNYKARSIGAL
jgi:hypothetical protein